MTHLLTNEHYGIAKGIILQNDNTRTQTRHKVP